MLLRSSQILEAILGVNCYLADAQLQTTLPPGNSHPRVRLEGIESIDVKLVIVGDDRDRIISRTESHPGNISLMVEHVPAQEKTPDKHRRRMNPQFRFNDSVFQLDLVCRGHDLFPRPPCLEFLTEQILNAVHFS
jgi:hypothetical protein